jgi:hypothetical protein
VSIYPVQGCQFRGFFSPKNADSGSTTLEKSEVTNFKVNKTYVFSMAELFFLFYRFRNTYESNERQSSENKFIKSSPYNIFLLPEAGRSGTCLN